MKLKLHNIKQHTEFIVEFPDTGIVLIKGDSGAGKTTILDAIEDALCGTGSNMVSYGSKYAQIELELSYPTFLRIIRTRGPASLKAIDQSGREYHDEEAQAIINQAMGMTDKEFEVCCYIRQGMVNSLLSYGPTDQLRIIESLSGGGSDAAAIKEKIAKKIKELDSKIAASEAELAAAVSSRASTEGAIQSIKDRIGKIAQIDGWQDSLRALRGKLAELKAQHQELSDKIDKNTALLNSPQVKAITNFASEMEALRRQLDEKVNKINELETKQQSLKESLSALPSPEDIAAKTTKAQMQKEYLLSVNKLNNIASEVRKKYPGVNQGIMSFLGSQAKKVDEEIAALEANKAMDSEKVKEIENLRKVQECPECHAPLAIMGGSIVRAQYVPKNLDDLHKSAQARLSDTTRDLAAKRAEKNEIANIIANILQIKQTMPSSGPLPDVTTIEQCDLIIANANHITAKRSSVLALTAEIERQKADIVAEKEKIVNKINELEKIYNDAKTANTPTADHILALIESDTAAKSLIAAEITRIEAEMSPLAESESGARLIAENLNTINNLQSGLAKILEKERNIQEILKKNLEKKIAVSRLKEISDYAALAAIEEIINLINANADKYISHMFRDDGTVVRIKNSAITKTGEERMRISTEIYHKGRQVKSLSAMSGGERSRVTLAFQLGLGALYRAPVLMVDEGFAGLPPEKKNECLLALKEVSSERLVLVVEHGATESFFDQVVEV